MVVYILLCLCFAALFINREYKKKYAEAVILKGLASLCFVLLGKSTGNGSLMSRQILIGLILGCIADILLNLRFVFEKKGKIIFLVGILVFLSGHIFYLAAILPICRYPMICALIAAAATYLLMKWIFTKITAQKAFKIFGIFYIGAIVAMNTVALCNLITDRSMFTVIYALGAVLFLISDIVLILNTFGKESRFSLRVTNLSLYYLGQILIALSLLYLLK